MPKTPNSNTTKKPVIKKKTHNTDPHHIFSWRSIPVSQAQVERITEDLLQFPKKHPEAKTITEFYTSYGLTKSNYYKLKERHPQLQDAHELTMRRLGERLWGKAVDNKANWNAVRFMLHKYGDEYKEAAKFHAQLRDAGEEASGPYQIVMQKYELKEDK